MSHGHRVEAWRAGRGGRIFPLPSGRRPMPTSAQAPRRIGVVGGVGPRAGFDLCQKIAASTRAARDQDHLPLALLSLSAGIPDRTAFLLGASDENPGPALADVAEALVDGGAEVVGIPCNTAHAPAIFGHVEARVGDRCTLVHLVDEVAAHVARHHAGARSVGVLTTTGTRAAGLYVGGLSCLGVEVVQVPEAVQREHVQPAIYDPAYGIKSTGGAVDPRAVAGLRRGLDALLGAGAEVVVLACTEIPVALSEEEVDGAPLLDATLVLARALVRESAPDRLLDA